MGRYVAFLRGINVGGKNKLPMADLRAMAEAAGAEEVSTYIQSGNVIFSASAALAKTFENDLSAQIKTRAGLDVPVIVRSAKQLQAAIAKNPYPHEDDDRMVHLGFLSKKPPAKAAKALDADLSPPDTFVVDGDTVFVHYPNGSARSKLSTAFFDKGLDCVSTFRNLRTAQKVLALATEG